MLGHRHWAGCPGPAQKPAGTGSSALPSWELRGWHRFVAECNRSRSKERAQLFLLTTASCISILFFFFYLKSMTINISSFPRHSASPWQAPEQGAASPRGWLMDAHQLFCLLQEECSEEHLSAQNSSEMQLCFTALNGP